MNPTSSLYIYIFGSKVVVVVGERLSDMTMDKTSRNRSHSERLGLPMDQCAVDAL